MIDLGTTDWDDAFEKATGMYRQGKIRGVAFQTLPQFIRQEPMLPGCDVVEEVLEAKSVLASFFCRNLRECQLIFTYYNSKGEELIPIILIVCVMNGELFPQAPVHEQDATR